MLLGLALSTVACTPTSSTGVTATRAGGTTAPLAPTATAEKIAKETPVPTAQAQSTATPLPDEELPAGVAQSFSTDFNRRSISFDEILSGGPPKDGIPAIDNPQFVSTANADEWLEELEPVTVFQEQDEVRIYPYQILTWHEIVNDVVGGRPVAVTFCPLCNTAIVFDATVDGMHLDFGTTGHLRYSNLLMYDRQTESWWQQATGQAVIGKFTGEPLSFVAENDTITDEQTGSVWNVLGQAVAGELAGQQLDPVVKVDHFWFSWAAFRPDTRIYQP